MFQGLAGNLVTMLLIDSVFFFIGLIAAIVIVCKRYSGSLRLILISYVVITFSAFNIFIKSVQDYNIPIPRTFIFYFKLFAGLSLFDFFTLCMVGFVVLSYLFSSNLKINYRSIYNRYYFRDIILLAIGILGTVIFQLNDGMVSWVVYVRMVRGILIGFVIIWALMLVKNRITDKASAYYLINTITILNFINIGSEAISSRFLIGQSWERLNHSVFLLDQSNANMVLIYGPMLLVPWKEVSRINKIFATVLIGLLVIDYLKIVYMEIGLVIFVLACVILFFKIKYLPKRILGLILLIIPVFLIVVIRLVTADSADIQTRAGQIDGVIDVLSVHPENIMTGIGAAGMFKRQTKSEDGGEIKAVMLDDNTNYQSAFQVPFLFYFKEGGLLAILVVLSWFAMTIIQSVNLLKTSWFLASCNVFLGVGVVIGPAILYADPQSAVYLAIAYLFLIFYEAIATNDFSYKRL